MSDKKNIRQTVTLIDRRTLAPDVSALTFTSDSDKGFDFQPGQYAMISMAGHDPRPYSIASVPSATKISFHIKDTGYGLSHALSVLETGQTLQLTLPFGNAYFQSASSTPLLLIGGGLGLAPLMPIAETAIAANPDRGIHLYHCVETADDLYLHGEIETLCNTHAGLKYTPVTEVASGRHITGLAPEAVARDLSKEFNQMDAYISGPPQMVLETVSALRPLGLDINRVYTDMNLDALDKTG